MSEREIFGKVPEPPKEVIKQAMDDLDDSFSNTINGSLKSKDVEYDPENGK
jgi:hypothetical protein